MDECSHRSKGAGSIELVGTGLWCARKIGTRYILQVVWGFSVGSETKEGRDDGRRLVIYSLTMLISEYKVRSDVMPTCSDASD